MGRALRIPFIAIAETWGHLEATLLGCLLATLLSLPMLAAMAFLAAATRSYLTLILGSALALAVLPNPAAAGLQLMFNDLVHREALAGAGEVWEGLRRFARPALRAWLLAAPITAVLILNLVFYMQHHLPISSGMILLTLLVLAVWFSVNFLVYPLLMEQEEARVLLAYRNAALLVVAHPLFFAILLPIWLTLILITTSTGTILLFGLAISSGIQQHAAHALLGMFARDTHGEEPG